MFACRLAPARPLPGRSVFVGLAVSAAAGLLLLGSGAGSARAQQPSGLADAAVPKDGPAAAQERLAEDINETIERVAVDVRLMTGETHRGEMVVTHFRPNGSGPFPVVVLSHGRSATSRHEPQRWRSLSLARYFTRRGFAVIVPTRVGYGALGQSVDPETSGACAKADYKPAVEAISAQVAAAAAYGARLPWADGRKVLLAGVSYGGFGTVAAAARDIPGLIGAINFAGGLGGSPERRPGAPCQAERIVQLAADAGAKTRVPMLWLYAENDKFWGETWPRRWHAAYTGAGGRATFSAFPAVGEDGHRLMSQGFQLWRPVVDTYLASLGIAIPHARSELPDSGFAKLADANALPYVKPPVKAETYPRFLAADIPRAFAVSPTGAWAWRSGLDAIDVAMKRCQINSRSTCTLYAVDDRVVFRNR